MRRQRDFRIRQFRRIYDRTEGKFTFNISYETHTTPTPRSIVVAEAFGLGIDETQKFKVLDAQLKIGNRDIVYITGDSITGQSSMYWRKNSHLQYGNMAELFKDFVANRSNSIFEVLSSGSKTIKNSCITWERVSEVIDHGIKPVFEISLSSGKSVQITKDHSLFYSEGYEIYPIDLAKLTNEKRLVCTRKTDFFEGEEKNIDDFLLVLGGLWIADGSYYKTGTLISTGNNKDIIAFLQSIPRVLTTTERISNIILTNPALTNAQIRQIYGYKGQDIKNARCLCGRYRNRSKYVHICLKKTGDVAIYNKGLQESLSCLGFVGDCYSKRVPTWLFTASQRQIGLFLKGYFSGDGSFHTKGKDRVVIEAASVNLSLLRDIQTLLERVGVQGCIGTGIYKQKSGFKSTNISMKISIERKNCIETFLHKIGFLYGIREDLIDILKRQRSVGTNTLMTRKIRDVKYIGERQVFDISVSSTQRFIAEGILCHNSGSGKSVLLRAIRADLGDEAIDLSEVQVDPDKPLIETVGTTVEQALELLSKVGLNDAFLFLRTFSQLSDGQKYRYRIAKLIESDKQWWLMDEFAACLDRDTAKIIAYNLQKLARQQGKAVISATTHSDLAGDLKPSVLVRKRFGEEIHLDYYPNIPAAECSIAKEMKVEQGIRDDWLKLAAFHYRGHNIAPARKIFRMTRGDELCGVIVYSYPPPACYGRGLVLPRMTMQQLNQQLSIINRVVIHPKYRTIGLGEKLIRDTLPQAGTPYVEMVAVMAKYSPFAERAGMRKVAEQQSIESIKRQTQVLNSLGFNLQLLGSHHYVDGKLESLNEQQVKEIETAFLASSHPRIKKEVIASHDPFGRRTATYTKDVRIADNHKLAKLIKILAMLSQTKVYLFWKKHTLV